MKIVKSYEDKNGVLHKTKEACILADAEASFATLVEECTAPTTNIFSIEEFLQCVRADPVLAKELSVLFNIKAEPIAKEEKEEKEVQEETPETPLAVDRHNLPF